MTPARRTLPLLVTALALTAAALTGCAPATRGENAVAVLNAPLRQRVQGSAQALESALAQGGQPPFRFLADSVMRFQEGHNDFGGSRSVGSAARVARSFGARVAVTVGAPVLDRSVTVSSDKSLRQVEVTLQMEVVVIDARTAQVVQHVYSQVLREMRVESNADDLPNLANDPTAKDLRDQAVADLAPAARRAIAGALSAAGVSGSNAE